MAENPPNSDTLFARTAAPVNRAGVAPVPVPLTPKTSPVLVAFGMRKGALDPWPCTATVTAEDGALVADAMSSVSTLVAFDPDPAAIASVKTEVTADAVAFDAIISVRVFKEVAPLMSSVSVFVVIPFTFSVRVFERPVAAALTRNRVFVDVAVHQDVVVDVDVV